MMHRDEDDDLSASSSEDSDISDDEKPKQSTKAPAASPPKKKKKIKKSQPGRYSQLVIDTIHRLGERNGSSLAKVYNEAKKVPWFDQQNGRTYLRYSIKALVQNDTLLQVKGTGANGSFKLNRRKVDAHVEPTAPKSPSSTSRKKKSHKKKQPSDEEPKKIHKKQEVPDPTSSPKKSHKKKSSKKEKSAKLGVLKMPKSKKA